MWSAKIISTTIRKLLIDYEMTQDELAARIGITHSTMCKKLKDPTRFTVAELIRIKKVFKGEQLNATI